MGNGFNKQSLKVQANMATERIKVQSAKRGGQLKAMKREVAQLVADGKVEKARIQVEGVLREIDTIFVMDLIQSDTMLIAQRVDYVDSQMQCPDEMLPAFCTILYCCTRMGYIGELQKMAEQLGLKYSEEWVLANKENATGHVPQRIIDRLRPTPPKPQVVEDNLADICKEHGVAYTARDLTPKKAPEEKIDGGGGFPEPMGPIPSVQPMQPMQPMPMPVNPGQPNMGMTGLPQQGGFLPPAPNQIQQPAQQTRFPRPTGPYTKEGVDRCLNFLHNPQVSQFSLQQKQEYLSQKQNCSANDVQMAMHVYTNPEMYTKPPQPTTVSSNATPMGPPSQMNGPPPPYNGNQPQSRLPPGPPQDNGDDDGFGDLEARFAALKKGL